MSTDTPRHRLAYDAVLAEPDTWRLLDNGREISVRAKVAGYEVAADIELRWKARESKAWPFATFVYPNDSGGVVWLTSPATLGGGLLRRELQLERAPDHVARVMLGW